MSEYSQIETSLLGDAAMVNIRDIEKEFLKKDIPEFMPGDSVDVHSRIKEADKERIQIFSGIVIARRGSGTGETFIVRRIVQGEGVERIFPVNSPHIARIVVKKKGNVRRAKLYYLRKRTGKAAKVRELIEKRERLKVTEPKEESKKENGEAAVEAKSEKKK